METLNADTEFVAGKNNISWVGSTFRKTFDGARFKKKSFGGLHVQRLPRDMDDTQILKELHPEPVELGDVLAFLEQADRSLWFLFYVADAKGTVWVLNAGWDAGGWNLEARSVTYPHGWGGGRVVVSRRFFDTQTKTPCPSDALTLGLEERVAKIEEILKHYNLNV